MRNPLSSDAQSLSDLPVGSSSRLITVKIDSADPATASSAILELKEKHNIAAIDVAIANAGISEDGYPIHSTPLSVLEKHMSVNAYGPIAFFQAAYPLLLASANPKFIGVSSMLASIGKIEDLAIYKESAYGMSKAVLNYLVRRVHAEIEGIVAVALDPGFVQTDMGNSGAKRVGMEKAWYTVDESINHLVKEIERASRKTTSGKFIAYGGEEFPW